MTLPQKGACELPWGVIPYLTQRSAAVSRQLTALRPGKALHHEAVLGLPMEEEDMAKIKHIALTTQEPAKVAAFYKEVFGMQELRRSPNGAVFLTDGSINLAILNWKTEQDADVGTNGPNYSGLHHIGFHVEDLDEACARLEKAQAQRLTSKAGLDRAMASRGPRNFEMKWAGPDGVVMDISHTGWDGTV